MFHRFEIISEFLLYSKYIYLCWSRLFNISLHKSIRRKETRKTANSTFIATDFLCAFSKPANTNNPSLRKQSETKQSNTQPNLTSQTEPIHLRRAESWLQRQQKARLSSAEEHAKQKERKKEKKNTGDFRCVCLCVCVYTVGHLPQKVQHQWKRRGVFCRGTAYCRGVTGTWREFAVTTRFPLDKRIVQCTMR